MYFKIRCIYAKRNCAAHKPYYIVTFSINTSKWKTYQRSTLNIFDLCIRRIFPKSSNQPSCFVFPRKCAGEGGGWTLLEYIKRFLRYTF